MEIKNFENKEEKGKIEEKEKVKEEIINLVIARLKTIPPKASLSIGEEQDFSKHLDVEDLIEHVRKEDEIGQQIIETQLNYIRSLKDLPVTIE